MSWRANDTPGFLETHEIYYKIVNSTIHIISVSWWPRIVYNESDFDISFSVYFTVRCYIPAYATFILQSWNLAEAGFEFQVQEILLLQSNKDLRI